MYRIVDPKYTVLDQTFTSINPRNGYPMVSNWQAVQFEPTEILVKDMEEAKRVRGGHPVLESCP